MNGRYLIEFTPELVERPIIYELWKALGIPINILRAEIDGRGGRMTIELSGAKDDVMTGIAFLRGKGVKVGELVSRAKRIEERCTDCGMCVSICPFDAIVSDVKTFEVHFDKERCISCSLCLDACPRKAIVMS